MTTGTSRAGPSAATSSADGHSLLERWAERDARYARRKPAQALTTHDVLVVREARIREAGLDPVATTLAARWVPPEHYE